MSSSGGWHVGYSGSHDDSGLGPDEGGEASASGGSSGDWAFIQEEEALPANESKWKDALIFLIDCSELMDFPADEESLMEMEEGRHIKVKGESGSPYTPGSASMDSHGSSAAASAADGAAAADSARPHPLRQQSQWQMVVSVVLHSVRQKIIANPDDFVGVCLFGTRELNNSNTFPHIFVHTPLAPLSAGAIRRMDQLLDEEQFERDIGRLSARDIERGKVEMDKILWVCSTMFQEANVSNCHKRVLLLTNNDLPFNTRDPMSRMRAVQKGKDLRDLDIAIDLIAVQKPPPSPGVSPPPFNPLLFFKDILVFDVDESIDSMTNTFRTKFADLRDRLFKKQMKKRALGSIPLQISNEVSIGVKLYCLLRITTKESAIMLDRETNQRLETQTRWLDTETGSVLKNYEMKKYYPYGGVKVTFTDDEMKQIKDICEPGLVLMGFKPHTALRVHHNIKNPYFIFPDDGQISDSSTAFKALLFACQQLKQIAIARLTYRKGSVPRFVALIPQIAKIDPDGGEVLRPPGFNLVFLPYADDLRNLRFEQTPIATDELILDAKKVVDRLTVKHIPAIPNPALQKHYRVIQAIALEEAPPGDDQIEDMLQPDTEGMAKYEVLIKKFAEDTATLGATVLADEEPPPSRKRKADGEGGGSKRPKAEEPDYDTIDWKQLMENDTLKKQTIPVLKVYLRHHKLPLAGTKADVLERVTNHLLTS